MFAISCFHDLNSNNRIDFDAQGISQERYGVSNNTTRYGPPVWSDAKFEVGTEDLNLEIKM